MITSPEWSGSETGGRRYAPFTINIERLKPWHTLSGRMHFFLDHDWMIDVGEALPIYRPPLDMHPLFGEPALGPNGEKGDHGPLPDPALQVVHPLRIPGQPVHALPVPRRSDGLDEPRRRDQHRGRGQRLGRVLNINGVFVARAIVSHRMPAGVVYVHHAQERTIDVPKSEATGRRGGIHNSVTRLLVKPSHLIGGYAQQSYAFNYLGPTGNQRDMVATVRRRSQEVQY